MCICHICRLGDLSNHFEPPAKLHPRADLDPAEHPASSLVCLPTLMGALLGGAAPAGTHVEACKRGCSSVTGWSFTFSHLSAEFLLNRTVLLRFLQSEFSSNSVETGVFSLLAWSPNISEVFLLSSSGFCRTSEPMWSVSRRKKSYLDLMTWHRPGSELLPDNLHHLFGFLLLCWPNCQWLNGSLMLSCIISVSCADLTGF